MSSLAEWVGFEATKSFRSARRAMRPQVGDAFVTLRDGVLLFAQVDWVGEEEIGLGRFHARTGEPIEFVKIPTKGWKAAVIRGLRMGCEFREGNGAPSRPEPL